MRPRWTTIFHVEIASTSKELDALKRRQNPELLSMIGLGASGGQLRADGSNMERGIHLRWQMGEEISPNNS
jgi:hypothetical protein